MEASRRDRKAIADIIRVFRERSASSRGRAQSQLTLTSLLNAKKPCTDRRITRRHP